MFTSTTTQGYISLDIEVFLLGIYNLISGFGDIDQEAFIETAQGVWSYFQFFSYLFIAVLLVGIIYCIRGIVAVRKKETEYYNAPKIISHDVSEKPKNEKWLHIEELTSSENPNDWRLAILEADILLDELINLMGYKGETMGEKMKSIEASDFSTLDQAWEAHKVRNQIAHTGSDFILTLHETRRVVDLYRQVFEEFHFI